MTGWGLAVGALGAAAAWGTLLGAVVRDGMKTRERIAVVETRVADLGGRLEAHERRPHPARTR